MVAAGQPSLRALSTGACDCIRSLSQGVPIVLCRRAGVAAPSTHLHMWGSCRCCMDSSTFLATPPAARHCWQPPVNAADCVSERVFGDPGLLCVLVVHCSVFPVRLDNRAACPPPTWMAALAVLMFWSLSAVTCNWHRATFTFSGSPPSAAELMALMQVLGGLRQR